VTPLPVRFDAGQAELPRLRAVLYLDERGRVVRPPLNPYLAVEFQSTNTKHEFRVTGQWLRLAEQLAETMRERGVHRELFLPPDVTDVRPWQWGGFRTGMRYTYQLHFPYDLRQADTGVRGRVKKAGSLGYRCERTTNMRDAWECLQATEERQGFAHQLSVEDLELARRCLGDEALRGYVCYAPDGTPAASAYVLHAPQARGIGWLAGAKREHLSQGAVQFLDSFLLADLQQIGAAGFDFVGANLPSIATAKSYWGGELVPYSVLEQPGWGSVVGAVKAWWRSVKRG